MNENQLGKPVPVLTWMKIDYENWFLFLRRTGQVLS
jgi:hypothetical protein